MSLGWLICSALQLELAAVAVEMSVAQMLKLHLSYMKVSVAVAAGADDHVLLTFLNVDKQLVSKCVKVFLI